MELPAIKIPEIPLPFDIPVLLHPPIDHFIIALPIVVLMLEIINLFAKKRAIGLVSFFLIVLTVVAAAAAYFTGSVDGKEAWDLLSQAGQAELKEHKLLGTYLMLASGVVLVFKLLSAMLQRGLMKGLFLLILIIFVVGILKQGKEGGELVYKYGANVERVADLDSELFDVQEELDELKEEAAKTPVTKAVEAVKEKTAEVTKAVKAKVTEVSKTAIDAKEAVETKTAKVAEAVAKKADDAKEATTAAVETVTEKVEEKAAEVKEALTPEVPKVESLAEEIKEPAVEVVPEAEAVKPEIATH